MRVRRIVLFHSDLLFDFSNFVIPFYSSAYLCFKVESPCTGP